MAASARARDITAAPRPRARRLGALAFVSGLAGLVGLTSLVGCSPTGSNDNQGLPSGVQDPAIIKTPDGALAFYRGVLADMPGMFNQLVANVGVMTDELAALPAPISVYSPYTDLDSRNVDGQNPGPAGVTYNDLHKLRAQAREARGFLATYLPDSSALAGHLYAAEGYAVVFLADLYCSGVPLSTVDFGGDYTMATGSSTEALYQHAAALFDTALTLASDNAHAQIQQLAAVGRGRALLALGQYDSAAAAVAAVPTEFRYDILFTGPGASEIAIAAQRAAQGFALEAVEGAGWPIMGDREGVNGLDYRSSGDPRTPVSVPFSTPDLYGNTIYFPANFPLEGPTNFVLAHGIEARLIEAEAALRASPDAGQWLATLNQLRASVGLADTTDPGTADARVDLLFRERAFWLYLTAHRQGDLRRLVRDYPHHPVTAVYPTGAFAGGGRGQYGSEVTLPVPAKEQQFNPNYTGCINRSA